MQAKRKGQRNNKKCPLLCISSFHSSLLPPCKNPKMHWKNLKKFFKTKNIFGENHASGNLNIMAIINNDILIDIFTFSSRTTLCRLECACRCFGRLVNTYFKTKPYHVLPVVELSAGYNRYKSLISLHYGSGRVTIRHKNCWKYGKYFGQRIAEYVRFTQFWIWCGPGTIKFIQQHYYTFHNIIGNALIGTKLVFRPFERIHSSRHAFVQFLCANLLPAIDACGAISIMALHVPHGVPNGENAIRLIDIFMEVDQLDLDAYFHGDRITYFWTGEHVLFDADEICDWLYYNTADDRCRGPPSMALEQKRRNRIIRLSHETLGFGATGPIWDDLNAVFKQLIQRLKKDFLTATMFEHGVSYRLEMMFTFGYNEEQMVEEFSLVNLATKERLMLKRSEEDEKGKYLSEREWIVVLERTIEADH